MKSAVVPLWYAGEAMIFGTQVLSQASPQVSQPPCMSFVVLGATNEYAGRVPVLSAVSRAPPDVVPSGTCCFKQTVPKPVKYGAAVCRGTYRPFDVFCREQLDGSDSA